MELSSVPFNVVECSSADDAHPFSALHTYREDGEGWVSGRDCEYPQTLILKVSHPEDPQVISKLEILCHESKIPERVEITLGIGGDDDVAPETFDRCESIRHLGYITMDSNQRTDFQARELKSIPIEKHADFIKLVLRECHKNPSNPHNQVGIIGIRVMVANGISGESPVKHDDRESRQAPQTSSASTQNAASVETNSAPVKKIEVPVAMQASLPSKVKHELDPKIQNSVDRLERLKKERAALEDFDTAAKIKESLGLVYALLTSFKETENMMREAAAQEDYVEASRLKSERDTKRHAAQQALDDVEHKYLGAMDDMVADLSISTIKDHSFVSQRSTHSIHQLNESNHVQKDKLDKSISFQEKDDISMYDRSIDQRDNASADCEDNYESHPLDGVDGAEELPTPEEINDESGSVSSDFIHKVENLVGGYRTKCLLSKNWMLREAALAKISIMAPDITGTNSSEGDFVEILCNIISKSLDDKNVQVYLAALILLDESMVQFERIEVPQNKMTSLVSKIITNLLGKLSDSKQKVADSAELSLISLAHSQCVDFSYICNAATKRIRSDDSKSGRAIKARLHFLENLVAEFGTDVAWERFIDFAKASKAFNHRDAGVRDAAKSMVATIMMLDSEGALKMIESSEQLSELSLREYKSMAVKFGKLSHDETPIEPLSTDYDTRVNSRRRGMH